MSAETVEVDGRDLAISNGDKLFFPERGITKRQLIDYYLAVGEGALTGCFDRPSVLKRYPNGAAGPYFFQKRAPVGEAGFLRTTTVQFPSGRSADLLVIDSLAALLWSVNLGCIDINPWPVRSGDTDHPDELRVDLDPQPDIPFSDIRRVALVVREVLESGAALLEADIAAYAVREGEVVAVKAFYDRDGFSAPDAAAAESVVTVLRDALPEIGAIEIGDGVAQLSFADHAFVHGRALIVPLKRDRPDTLAALVFQRSRESSFDDDDGRLATTMAAQLSLTLRNVHAFQREHEIAETFQKALLVEPPLLAGAEIGVKYQAAARAARVGGDFYDILQLSPGRVLIAVGDVCGRGLQAAVETALLRYTLRAYAQESSPGEALSRLNSALLAQDPELPFATIVLACLDVRRRNLEYAVAGHPRPIVLAGRRRFAIAQAGGFPISMFAGETYTTNRCVLPEAATIILYTDGLTEARRGGHMLGERGLRETVRRHLDEPAQQLAESLLGRAARYAGGTPDDDMAVVVVKLP